MGVDWRKEEILPLGLYCIVTRPGLIISCVWSTDIITIIIISLQCIDDIMCLVDRRGWQRHQRTLGNAYTHNDRSSSRLSGLYLCSCSLVHFNCFLHGSKRQYIYIIVTSEDLIRPVGITNHYSQRIQNIHERVSDQTRWWFSIWLIAEFCLYIERTLFNGNWCISP